MPKLSKFKKVDIVKAAKELAAKESTGGGAEFMKLTSRATPYRIRILPALEGSTSDLPWEETKSHYVKIPGAEKAVFGNCGKAHDRNAPCAICELGEALTARGGDANLELAKSCKPRYAGFVYAIDREHPEKGIQVLRLPWGVRQDLMNWATTPELGLTNFCDPYEGRDILLSKTGTGFNTKYSVQPNLQQTPICESDEALDALMAPLGQLSNFTKAADYSSVKGKIQEALSASVGTLPAAPAEEPKAVEASVVHANDYDQDIKF